MYGPDGTLRVDRVLLIAMLVATMLTVFVIPRMLPKPAPDVQQAARSTDEPNIFAAARARHQAADKAVEHAEDAPAEPAWQPEVPRIGPHPAELPASQDAPASSHPTDGAGEG